MNYIFYFIKTSLTYIRK